MNAILIQLLLQLIKSETGTKLLKFVFKHSEVQLYKLYTFLPKIFDLVDYSVYQIRFTLQQNEYYQIVERSIDAVADGISQEEKEILKQYVLTKFSFAKHLSKKVTDFTQDIAELGSQVVRNLA